MSRLTILADRLRIEIRSRARLAKFLLCLLIGGSTIFGYILARPVLSVTMMLVGCGVFVLATGAATINSLQECHLDSRMERTRQRPLPRGQVTPVQAGWQGVVLLAIGLTLISLAAEKSVSVWVALFAVVLYNGVYTPLKQTSVLSLVPGALCGALPPYIGWLAGGGAPLSYSAALLAALFVLWQIPHFWLVVLDFQDDYVASSLPNPVKQFGEAGLNRLFVTWVGSMAMVMLLFVTFPLGGEFRVAVCANTGVMVLFIAYGLAFCRPRNYRLVFLLLNLFLLLHMVIVAAGCFVF
ncbi:MAG: UbiA family prenyltransferase [Desulforhopalus sp.]